MFETLMCPASWPELTYLQEMVDFRNTSNANNKNAISKCLSLYYQNVRGLRTKSHDVFLATQRLPFDVFALTETNLTNEFNSNEYFTSDFNIYRRDGQYDPVVDLTGRGVLIAVHVNFDSSALTIPNTDNAELICAKIKINRKHIFVLCCYIRPLSPIESYKRLRDAIDFLFDMMDSHDDLFVVGDFNLPNLTWSRSEDNNDYVQIQTCNIKKL